MLRPWLRAGVSEAVTMLEDALVVLLPVEHGATRLRRLTVDDLDVFHAYRSDEALAYFQGWAPMWRGDARRFLVREAGRRSFRPGGWVQLAICDSVSDAILGDLGVYVDRDLTTAETGFTLAREAQGRGHAARAVRAAAGVVFAATAVREIRGVVNQANRRSQRVLERAGFVRQGQQSVRFRGRSDIEFVYVLPRHCSG